AKVACPVAGGTLEQVAKDVLGHGRDYGSPGEVGAHDDASHAILPICPAGWSRTSRPSTSVSTRRLSRVTISTLWVAIRTAIPKAAMSSSRSMMPQAVSA